MRKLKDYVACIDIFAQKHCGQARECVGALGGEVAARSPFAAAPFHLGMAAEVVGQTVGYDVALTYDIYSFGHSGTNLGVENREVGSSEQKGVDLRICTHKLSYVFGYEIVGAGLVGLAVFDQWYPHWSGLGCERNGAVGIQLLDLHIVAV